MNEKASDNEVGADLTELIAGVSLFCFGCSNTCFVLEDRSSPLFVQTGDSVVVVFEGGSLVEVVAELARPWFLTVSSRLAALLLLKSGCRANLHT